MIFIPAVVVNAFGSIGRHWIGRRLGHAGIGVLVGV
jgi:hypothetical protein